MKTQLGPAASAAAVNPFVPPQVSTLKVFRGEIMSFPSRCSSVLALKILLRQEQFGIFSLSAHQALKKLNY